MFDLQVCRLSMDVVSAKVIKVSAELECGGECAGAIRNETIRKERN